MSRNRRLVLSGVLVLAILLAGCLGWDSKGDEGGGDGTSGTQDGICNSNTCDRTFAGCGASSGDLTCADSEMMVTMDCEDPDCGTRSFCTNITACPP